MSSLIASLEWHFGHVRPPRIRATVLRVVGTKTLFTLLIVSLLLPLPVLLPSSSAQRLISHHVPQEVSTAEDNTTGAANTVTEQPRLRAYLTYLPVSPVKHPGSSEASQQTKGVQSSSVDNSVGDVTYVANSQQIGRTRNFSSPSPNWISITGAITGTIYDFILDPFDPYDQAWAVGSTGVWKTTNLDAEAPVWSQILSMQTISETVGPHDRFHAVGRILSSPARQGFYLVTVWDDNPLGGNDQGGWIGRTFDAGATWQWSQLQADDTWYGSPNHSEVSPVVALDMADDGSGRIWLGLANDAGQPRIHYSPDWGASWQYIREINMNWRQPRNMYIPDLNPGVIYMNQGYSLTQSLDGGYTWVDITPTGARPSMKPRGMAGVSLLPSEFFFMSEATSRGPVYRSSDVGVSFPITFTTPQTPTCCLYYGNDSVVATLSAFDPNLLAALVLRGCSGNHCPSQQIAIGFSDDGGITWSNRTGDWHTVLGSWAGATGSSAGDGNVFIQNPKKIVESTPTIDLRADHLEVTQAIQNLKNNNDRVRLVKNKPTMVRFHVSSSSGSHRTTARLVATNSTGTSITLDPITNRYAHGYISVKEKPDRDALHHAFLFRLPSPSHTQGTVTLTAELNPGHVVTESYYTNNTISTTVTFEPVPRPNVYIYRLGHGPLWDQQYPTMDDVEATVSWIESAYPLDELEYRVRTLYHPGHPRETLSSPAACLVENLFLILMGKLDSIADFSSRHYGIVVGMAGGCAFPNTPRLGGIVASGDTRATTGAHEVGHMYGRLHPRSCVGDHDFINDVLYGDPNYPYDPNNPISPVTNNDYDPAAIFGFDARFIGPPTSKDIYPPSSPDIMGYCPGTKWISNYTYHGLMDYFQNPLLPQAQQRVDATDRLAVFGFADLNTNQVNVQPLFVIPNADDLEPRTPGEYAIVLRDALNNELARYPFTPDTGNDGPIVVFTELVPYVTGTVRVDIEKPGGSLLTSSSAGAAAPLVNVTAPNGGEILAGDTVTVSWSASDPDGDPLIFDARYSPDNGANWYVVAQNITGTNTIIDSDNLSGSTQALFQVWASDGIHTGIDASDAPFTVPNHLPIAEIREPADPVTIAMSQTLGLRAYAYDFDIGSMHGSQIQWRSNIDGLLGNGKQFSVVGLSTGTHTVTLEVDDGAGGIVTDRVQVTVVADLSQLPPPPNELLAGPSLIIYRPSVGAVTASIAIDNQNLLNPIAWTATTSEDWVQLSATSGTTPDTITATLNDTGLPEGFYTATIIITSPDVPGDRVTIDVEATITNRIYLPIILK